MVPVSYLRTGTMISLQAAREWNFVDIPIKDTAKGHEAANDDGRRRRARDMIGFFQHKTHDG